MTLSRQLESHLNQSCHTFILVLVLVKTRTQVLLSQQHDRSILVSVNWMTNVSGNQQWNVGVMVYDEDSRLVNRTLFWVPASQERTYPRPCAGGVFTVTRLFVLLLVCSDPQALLAGEDLRTSPEWDTWRSFAAVWDQLIIFIKPRRWQDPKYRIVGHGNLFTYCKRQSWILLTIWHYPWISLFDHRQI